MVEKNQTKKQKPDYADFKSFIAEFRSETDRAAVILGAARLDLILYQLLVKFLLPNPTSTDELFESEGPLSSLSAKINLASRLGLIDHDLARALHLIRKIRNSFAHETTGCKLESGAHKDRVKELILPLEKHDVYKTFREVISPEESSGSSADFRAALALVAARLEGCRDGINQLAPPGTPWGLMPPVWPAEKRDEQPGK